jgi:hypothetical protein
MARDHSLPKELLPKATSEPVWDCSWLIGSWELTGEK